MVILFIKTKVSFTNPDSISSCRHHHYVLSVSIVDESITMNLNGDDLIDLLISCQLHGHGVFADGEIINNHHSFCVRPFHLKFDHVCSGILPYIHEDKRFLVGKLEIFFEHQKLGVMNTESD